MTVGVDTMVLPKQLLLKTVVCACAAFLAVPAHCGENDAQPASASTDATDDEPAIGLNGREQRKKADHEKGVELCKKFAYDTESFVDNKAIQVEAAAVARTRPRKEFCSRASTPDTLPNLNCGAARSTRSTRPS